MGLWAKWRVSFWGHCGFDKAQFEPKVGSPVRGIEGGNEVLRISMGYLRSSGCDRTELR